MGNTNDVAKTAEFPDRITGRAAKIVLPCFVQTEICDACDQGSTPVTTKHCTYFVRTKFAPVWRRSDGPQWQPYHYNFFPMVLDARGIPWAEAVVYILALLEDAIAPEMSSYAGIVDDLKAYRHFLDVNRIDWTIFPLQKLLRPTYRFRSHLMQLLSERKIAETTAQRQMGSVIAFHRWLKSEGSFVPTNPAWIDKDTYIRIESNSGRRSLKKVLTTNLAIPRHTQHDPYDGMILDGGRLRPLPMIEQEWLIDALESTENPELMLIHLVALRTGARIQTVLTIRKRHVIAKINKQRPMFLLPVGPGTDIDTKNNKHMVLHIPVWLAECLLIYAKSDRAKSRRLRASGGDYDNQYLFLSQRGAPLYQGKREALSFNSNNTLRHKKVGQGVRQNIVDTVIPFIQMKYSPTFHYRVHDLRATAGMNWTEYQLQLVAEGKITLHQAVEAVAVFLGHNSIQTTMRYIEFKHNVAVVREVQEDYERRLERLGHQAMTGVL